MPGKIITVSYHHSLILSGSTTLNDSALKLIAYGVSWFVIDHWRLDFDVILGFKHNSY